jgi:transposase
VELTLGIYVLKRTSDELDKIVSSTRKTKYGKEIRAGKIVGKYNMGKFIIFEGSGDDLTYRLDEEKILQESALDGCYIIYTDVPAKDMTAVQTVQSYKSLIQVEQAFRNMKTVQLEVRPIYHKKDDRIRCHVFICMLAYYVMWHMVQRLQPLFENNGQGKDRKHTFQYIIERLKSIRKESVDFMGAESSVITQPSEEQRQILNLLQIGV